MRQRKDEYNKFGAEYIDQIVWILACRMGGIMNLCKINYLD